MVCCKFIGQLDCLIDNNLLLNKFNRKSWDSFRTYNLSYIFQDYKLLEDITVIDNIKIVTNSNNKIKQLLAKLEINKIQKQKVNKLSGGEKQRISIARAVLKDAQVILLDEATASLDPENEVEMQKAIDTLIKGRTVITIAHKLKTIMNANRIIVLDDGQVKEQGTHDELIRVDGLYARLWKIQESTSGWNL